MEDLKEPLISKRDYTKSHYVNAPESSRRNLVDVDNTESEYGDSRFGKRFGEKDRRISI
jgi:hypothetical protein